MPSDLEELLQRYAEKGLAQWQTLTQEEKDISTKHLGMRIAEHEWNIRNTIMSPSNTSLCFIPMPKVNHRGIKRCFFLPIGSPYGDQMTFELFLVVNEKYCLGFRFEPAELQGTHNYSHIQITPQLSLESGGIPSWLPDSYPAFPIGSAKSLDMFLYMATSVHGYEGGMTRVIREMFQDYPGLGQPIMRRCLARLQRILISESSTRTDGSSENIRP